MQTQRTEAASSIARMADRFADYLEIDWHALFEERAAILQYDGGHAREEAERRAQIEVDALRIRVPQR